PLLTGVNASNLAAGQAAVACIRPERIRLVPPDTIHPNTLPATVHSLIYFGDHVRVRCSLTNQDDCFVKLVLGDPALAELTEGTHVTLELDPERLRIFI
ncbi:MAG: TOBE domain-containing protein, partial [Herbaspirillum sp.]